MKIFSYPRKINDWRRKTAKLPLEQRGIYSELIDWYYVEGGLNFDLTELARMIGATTRSERENLKKVAHNPDLFTIINGRLVQPMCDETIVFIASKSEAARNSAASRYNKNNDLSPANAERTQSERTANHKPITIEDSVESTASQEFDEFWSLWTPFDMDKGNKASAKKNYLKARKETTHAALVESSGKYCAQCAARGQRTKHAASWLNQRGWEDELSLITPRSSPGPADRKTNYADSIRDAAVAAVRHSREEEAIREESDS